MNVPEYVFAADFIAASRLAFVPACAAMRAGALPALSWSRIHFQRFPLPEMTGGSDHCTLICAAAWIASYSFGATTPSTLPTCTIFTPARCLIEFSSILTATGFVPSPYAPWPRGRTMRPCHMFGIRTLTA